MVEYFVIQYIPILCNTNGVLRVLCLFVIQYLSILCNTRRPGRLASPRGRCARPFVLQVDVFDCITIEDIKKRGSLSTPSLPGFLVYRIFFLHCFCGQKNHFSIQDFFWSYQMFFESIDDSLRHFLLVTIGLDESKTEGQC